MEELPESLRNLSCADRRELIGLLWDSLDNDNVLVPETQLAELDRRAGSLLRRRGELCAWPEIQAELQYLISEPFGLLSLQVK
jgi:putative addiction module component (TIGR02574 family)